MIRLRCTIAIPSFIGILWSVLALPTAALAGDDSRITLLEENDSLYFNSDKHYTQGFRISHLGPEVAPESWWNGPFNLIAKGTPLFADGDNSHARRFFLDFGQSFFTPKNIGVRPPDPRDRPYAGWFYVGGSLLQESHKST